MKKTKKEQPDVGTKDATEEIRKDAKDADGLVVGQNAPCVDVGKQVDALGARNLSMVAGLLAGSTVIEAGREAGIPAGSTQHGVSTPGLILWRPCNAMSRALLQLGVDVLRVAERIRDGIDATRPNFVKDEGGAWVNVGDSPDWKARVPYVEMAAKAHGMTQDESAAGEESISLRVIEVRRRMAGSGS